MQLLKLFILFDEADVLVWFLQFLVEFTYCKLQLNECHVMERRGHILHICIDFPLTIFDHYAPQQGKSLLLPDSDSDPDPEHTLKLSGFCMCFWWETAAGFETCEEEKLISSESRFLSTFRWICWMGFNATLFLHVIFGFYCLFLSVCWSNFDLNSDYSIITFCVGL